MQLLLQLRSDGCCARPYETIKLTVMMLQRTPLPKHLRTLRWGVFKSWVTVPDDMNVAA